MHSKVLHHILTNKLQSSCQHGFRPGFSTQETLLIASNYWHTMLSNNGFFDIRKTFDSVSHRQVINSLTGFGISGPLLKLPLEQTLSTHALSTTGSHTSGVPQGPILGPLLFIMFMNSLTKVPLSDNTKLILYADDILLYKPVNSDQDSDTFQQDVNSIQNWTNSHGLKLNASKSCLMSITHAKNPPRLSISVDGPTITCVQQTKYLGVTISADLTWSKHIDHTCKSAKHHLGMIHRKFHQSSPQVRSKLYSSVILPKLEYCCSVWDPHQRKCIDKLDSDQRYACGVTTKALTTKHYQTG